MKAKVKGKVYKSEAHRVRCEDLYRKAWEAQNKLDRQVNPKMQINSLPIKKKIRYPSERPLSMEAKTVNNLLNHGMLAHQIAEALHMEEHNVFVIIRKYALPRGKET